MNKSLLICSIAFVFVVSCTENQALKKKYNYIDEKDKDWLCTDSIIRMIDDLGFEYIFVPSAPSYSFLTGSTRILFVYTNKTEDEYILQTFNCSTHQIKHNVSLIAYSEGNTLSISLGDNLLYYNLEKKTVQYYSSDVVVEFLETYSTASQSYRNLIHLKFTPTTTNEYEIVELYYAQKKGLVEFVYKNGVKCRRL